MTLYNSFKYFNLYNVFYKVLIIIFQWQKNKNKSIYY